MPGPTTPAISTELAAAQALLAQRRDQQRRERVAHGLAINTDLAGRLLTPVSSSPPPPTAINQPYPGWESDALTRAQQAAARRRAAAAAREEALRLEWLPQPASATAHDSSARRNTPPASAASVPHTTTPDTVRLYPDLALAMLREEAVAPGRIWLLLRHLDGEGRGWVRTATARKELTGPRARRRVCGWRQLRKLLAQGDGVFWSRKDAGDRIWLRSTARVAAALQVPRLRLRPVALPVTILCGSIGTVRAHFYASYHSSRREAAPISRETLSALADVSRRTQQRYEQRSGVRRQHNWAIGPHATKETLQQRAWRHGSAIFRFTDRRGRHGKPGEVYVAWQLPNSFEGPHTPLSRGRQRQINRQLVDLFMKGITGNGRRVVEAPVVFGVRCFYARGEAAVKGCSRAPETDAYWPSFQKAAGCHMWHLLPGRRDQL